MKRLNVIIQTYDRWHVLTRLPAVLLLCFLLRGEQAAASFRPAATLTAEENQAEAALELDSVSRSGYGEIRSLQLSFQVNILQGNPEECQISFEFDEGISGSVRQFRYQEETGILQIFVSGEQNLYEKNSLVLGKIVLNSDSQTEATASIRVLEDSLKIVNDAFDMREQSVSVPSMVQVKAGNGRAVKNDSQEEEEISGSQEKETAAGSQEDRTEKDGENLVSESPILRLLPAEEKSRFSFAEFFSSRKNRILSGIGASSAVMLAVGLALRGIHKRKAYKRKIYEQKIYAQKVHKRRTYNRKRKW